MISLEAKQGPPSKHTAGAGIISIVTLIVSQLMLRQADMTTERWRADRATVLQAKYTIDYL